MIYICLFIYVQLSYMQVASQLLPFSKSMFFANLWRSWRSGELSFPGAWRQHFRGRSSKNIHGIFCGEFTVKGISMDIRDFFDLDIEISGILIGLTGIFHQQCDIWVCLNTGYTLPINRDCSREK